ERTRTLRAMGDAMPLEITLTAVIREGKLLLGAREVAPPGEFGRWIDEHFPPGRRYAYGAMRFAVYAMEIGEVNAIEAVRPAMLGDLQMLVGVDGIQHAVDDLGLLLLAVAEQLPPLDLTDNGEEWWRDD